MDDCSGLRAADKEPAGQQGDGRYNGDRFGGGVDNFSGSVGG